MIPVATLVRTRAAVLSQIPVVMPRWIRVVMPGWIRGVVPGRTRG